MSVSLARAAVAALAVAAGSAMWWVSVTLEPPPAPSPPPTRNRELSAKVVATLEDVVKTKRRGRVLAVLVRPGQSVRTGEALFEFEDLGLRDSREDLEREIATLRTQMEAEPVPGVGEDALAVRLAALKHLEESHALARKDFQRWQALYDEGLLARREYERKTLELGELQDRVERARAAAAEQPTAATTRPTPPALRRAERLLERVNRLSDSFVVRSPWDGTVRATHVALGEEPTRGEPLATIGRTAMPNLEAETEGIAGIVAIRSACGISGPFAFTLRDGTATMLAPSQQLRPNDSCAIVVEVRE